MCEYVQHSKAPGEQLLFGMRYTRDFGRLVTLGFGGVEVEHLARNIVPGRDVAILSPHMADTEHIDRALDGKTIVPLLCGGVRHQEPRLHRAKLVALLQQALLAAACMPDLLVEFEINPLVPTAHGVVALDALARLGPGARPGPTGSAGGTPVASGIESGNTSAGVMSARSVRTGFQITVPLWVEFITDRSVESMADILGADPAMPDPFAGIPD